MIATCIRPAHAAETIARKEQTQTEGGTTAMPWLPRNLGQHPVGDRRSVDTDERGAGGEARKPKRGEVGP